MTNMRILFVCYGNMCRSPMAEGLARKMLASQADVGAREPTLMVAAPAVSLLKLCVPGSELTFLHIDLGT